jgi:hypothetical protein
MTSLAADLFRPLDGHRVREKKAADADVLLSEAVPRGFALPPVAQVRGCESAWASAARIDARLGGVGLQPVRLIKEYVDGAHGRRLHIRINHGTTTLAFRFDGGIIVAVDSRATGGQYIGVSVCLCLCLCVSVSVCVSVSE